MQLIEHDLCPQKVYWVTTILHLKVIVIFSENKRVVDFGSGCGLTGLMALHVAKCKHVQFVDIDHFAGYAVNLNAQLSNICKTKFECINENWLGKNFEVSQRC